MGFWAGIKHALNSTVGTADFQPLNDMVADVKSTVIGQRTLAASDSTIKVLLSTQELFSNRPVTVGTFTPQVNGSVRITGDFTVTDAIGSGYYLVLDVYLGTSQVARTLVELSANKLAYTLTRDLEITKGNTYVVKVYADARTRANSVNVCANVIDTSLVG